MPLVTMSGYLCPSFSNSRTSLSAPAPPLASFSLAPSLGNWVLDWFWPLLAEGFLRMKFYCLHYCKSSIMQMCQAIKPEDISQYTLTPSSQDSASAQKTTAMLRSVISFPQVFNSKDTASSLINQFKSPRNGNLIITPQKGCMGQTAWISFQCK